MRFGIPAALAVLALAAAPRAAPAVNAEASGPVDAALAARVRAAVAPDSVRATLRGFTGRGRELPLVDGPVTSFRVAADLAAGSFREDTGRPPHAFTQRLVGRLAWEGAGGPRPAGAEATARIGRRFAERSAPWAPALVADSLVSAGVTTEGWVRLAVPADPEREWLVDPETGRVMRYVDRAPGAAPVEVDYSDWRETGGASWPFRATVFVGGHAVRETVWDRVEPSRDLSGEQFLPGGKSDL